MNLLILPTYTNAVYICKQAALQQMVMVCLHFCMYMYISMHLPGIHVGSISDTLCKHVSTRQPKFVPVVQIEDYPGLLNSVVFREKSILVVQPVVFSTCRSEAVVPVLVLLFVAL